MDGRQADSWSRREFLSRLTMAGTAGLLGLHSRPVGAEPPPETTTLRLGHGALCEAPALLAEALVDKGITPRYDYAFQTMKDVPYGKWREYDPEDTVRFYALRLHEVGMIKSSPQKIIAQGTDWSFLNELKREPKG